MAKKQTKESLHEMSVQELRVRLLESQEKSFRLRFQHASNPLKNPMVIRSARRDVAKVLTVLRQKETIGPMRPWTNGPASSESKGRREGA
jgi:large subunit ribosomal protein L29